jgi:hypothetical protein
VGGGRGGPGVRGEDGVGELEEGVCPAVEASIERAAEGVESIVGIHDAPIMHSSTDFRTPYLPVELKRKLRAYPKNPDNPTPMSTSPILRVRLIKSEGVRRCAKQSIE